MSRIVEATISLDEHGQVIHLPACVAFPGRVHRVEILAIGNTRIITPAGMSWDVWFDHPHPDADLTAFERRQPDPQERDPL